MKILIFSSMNFDINTGSIIRAKLLIKSLYKVGNLIAIVGQCKKSKGELLPYGKVYDYCEYQSLKQALEISIDQFDPDIIFSVTIGFLNIVRDLAKKKNKPYAVDLHGLRTLEVFSESISAKEKYRIFRESLKWEIALKDAAFISVANPNLMCIAKKYCKNVVPTYGLVDDIFFNIPPCNNVCEKTTFLYAGNMQPYQGVNLFLKTVDLLPDVVRKKLNIIIIGTTSGTKKTIEKMEELGNANKVSLLEPIPFGQFPAFLSSIDVCVIPRPFSLAAYFAFPQKLVEFLSAGKCVIATNLKSHRYAIEDGVNGILCSPSVKGLSEAINLSLDKNLCIKLGRNARENAVKQYKTEYQIKKIMDAFNIYT